MDASNLVKCIHRNGYIYYRRKRPVIHGHSRTNKKTPTYNAFQAMKFRSKKLGIRISKEWNRFDQFLADMGEKPSGKMLTLRDKTKDFSKENCYWNAPTKAKQCPHCGSFTLGQ